MKTLPTLILLALICFLHHSSAQGPFAPELVSERCCPSFNRRLIPKKKVKHVARTQNHCKTPAIVVTTVCDETSCIDPDWRWAKKLLAEFETATANNRSPSAPFNTSSCAWSNRVSDVICCPDFTRRLIPKSKVKHVAMTPNSCKTQAIVVTNVCDTTSCLDPEWRLAKKLLAAFETATANNMSPSAPFGRSRCDK